MTDPFGPDPASTGSMEPLAKPDAPPDARTRLVETWLPVVLRWCATLGGPRVDPEDAAQEVLIVAMRRIDALYGDERAAAWLFGITRRVLAQHRRRAWARRWIPGLAP